jgi:hypothetical protein
VLARSWMPPNQWLNREFVPAPWAILDSTVPAKKPSPGALLLGLIPFLAMCFSVALWDRVDPMIFGIPFNIVWLLSWIVLSSLCMWGAYRLEARREKREGSAR